MKTSDLAYELRCATKRTDLPDEIVRLLSEAYEAIEVLRNERDLARREVCRWEANHLSKSVTECARLNEWDCFREDGK